jgi:hypothetical protein
MKLLENRYDLTLCPARQPYPTQGDVEHLADTRLELEWDEPLFAAIGPPLGPAELRRCKPTRLPQNVVFRWLGDEGLQERTCDARGNRLTHVQAGTLAAVARRSASRESAWNRAVVAFLAALPHETPVVLFWR